MSAPMIPIADPPSMIGKIVHVRGWPGGCQFRLTEINGEIATLKTPKTNRVYRVKATDLLHARCNEPKEPTR